MAQSRRRERELARRRFERRRMAAMQAREAQRKRNTQIGAGIGVVAVIAAVIATGIVIDHNHNNSTGKKSISSATSPATTPASTATTPVASGAVSKCAKIAPDPIAKGEPAVPQVSKPPTKLEINDIKTGTGAVAKDGDSVTVKYIGVACSTGKSFDASYTDGAKNQEFTFKLGEGQVIKGWDEGVAGMKVGGTRQLVIPSALGYGASGSGSAIPPNEVLNFVITLDKVSK